MKFNFINLDEETRQLMLDEIKRDITSNQLYPSKYFNEIGVQLYPEFLRQAVINGDEQTLATVLKSNNCFKAQVERKAKTGVTLVKVPETANETIAQGEFNRFYIRALCIKANASKQRLEIYRARYSDNPRPESEMLIGKIMDANSLLNDLRNNIGIETVLGIPGINSGLSLKLI